MRASGEDLVFVVACDACKKLRTTAIAAYTRTERNCIQPTGAIIARTIDEEARPNVQPE
jgi:hypothetical protein